MSFSNVPLTRTTLETAGHICTREIATVVFLAARTQKPILVEGPAGVGKTELAKAVSRSLHHRMIRLQCYDGLARQMVDAMTRIRGLGLKKTPRISETLDWAHALIALQVETLSPETLADTLNVICKHREDHHRVREQARKVANFS